VKELVILDLDNVIIKGQSQKLLLNYLFKKKLIGYWYFLKIYFWFIFYKAGLIKNPKRVMEYAFGFLKDKKVENVNEIANDFFDNTLKKFIYKEMVDIINEHKNKEKEVVLVSNAIDIIVKKVAQFLNIKNYISTQLEIINNKYTGKIAGDIVYGENKVNYIKGFIKKNNLTLDNSWAYGDHISDIGFLEISAHPNAINPDKLLLIEAQKRNWPILNFNL